MVHAWVKTRPWALSENLASMSPFKDWVFGSCEPPTLKVTLEGVVVLTSSEVPLMLKSFPNKSFEDFPRSYTRCTISNG